MPRATRDFATLELTQSAYDEIEAKLLAAGYEHLFAAGPGSAIDLQGIAVTREPTKGIISEMDIRKEARRLSEEAKLFIAGLTTPKPQQSGDYCFMCDEMVSAPCDRENCLRRANDRVRADWGWCRNCELRRHRRMGRSLSDRRTADPFHRQFLRLTLGSDVDCAVAAIGCC